MFDVAKIREDFPVLHQTIHGDKRLVFFDSAASSQKPRQVYEKLSEVYSAKYANVHRGIHYLSEVASDAYESTREKTAKFVNAPDPTQIVFGRNTSESINLVATSYGLEQVGEGDHVLTTIAEHHSNLVPWQQVVKKKKGVLDIVEVGEDYRLDLDQYKELLDEQPKVVALQHVSNVLGTIHPVKDMIRWAHEAGAVVMLDAAQSAPHLPLDVQDLDADFMAVSSHKMLGPTGIGFLYGKRELLEGMEPVMFGGDMISEVHAREAVWADIPFKFEAGTPNIADTIGFGAALDYLNELGMTNVQKYEDQITHYTLKRLAEVPEVEVIGPATPKDRGAVFSFKFGDLHPHDVAQLLDMEGVAVRSGHHCAQPLVEFLKLPATTRASLYLYNTKEEVDYFINALETVRGFFG